jgi:hypothetical protein
MTTDNVTVIVWDGVTFKADARGRVYWSDGWHRVEDARRAGILTHKHYGPETYGHVDYFVTR